MWERLQIFIPLIALSIMEYLIFSRRAHKENQEPEAWRLRHGVEPSMVQQPGRRAALRKSLRERLELLEGKREALAMRRENAGYGSE